MALRKDVENIRGFALTIRVSLRERESWNLAAIAAGLSVSDWIRDMANEAVEQQQKGGK